MRLTHRHAGNALVMALLFAVILTAIAGTGFRILQDRYQLFHQAASWQEALLASEAGIDIAVAEMRKSLGGTGVAWQGWSVGESGVKDYTSTVLVRQGEGGQRSWAQVSVDAPAYLVDDTGEQWFRVRSMGVAEVPGSAIAVGERADLMLRKLDLFNNRRTGTRVLKPQATRLIEAVVKPVGTFPLALMGAALVNLNNHNIVVDSFDSRTPATASDIADASKTKITTPQGTFVRRSNGSVATNGQLLEAGNAKIHGSASTNGGTVLNATNVQGEIRNDFYQEILTVERPDVFPDSGTPSQVIASATLVAKPNEPAQFLFSRIRIEGQQILRIQGAADGSETFAQIIVTGDVLLSGQSKIVLDPGVYVRIFIEGNADFSGQGVANPNRATHFQVYGVDRPKDADGNPISIGTINIAGNGGFSGSIYAPDYNISLVGGGGADTIFGAFVGNTVRMTGVQAVHYDEALSDGGLISDYKVVSWFEDVR